MQKIMNPTCYTNLMKDIYNFLTCVLYNTIKIKIIIL
jgi:hypothetical protein